MKKEETKKIAIGIHKIFWKSGGFSIAAVGMLPDGTKWLAPLNWTFPDGNGDHWEYVEKTEEINIDAEEMFSTKQKRFFLVTYHCDLAEHGFDKLTIETDGGFVNKEEIDRLLHRWYFGKDSHREEVEYLILGIIEFDNEKQRDSFL